MTAFPFVGGDFSGRSPSFDAQRTINFYVETSESGSSRSPAALIGTPGMLEWCDLGIGPVRGCIAFNNDLAVVVADSTAWLVSSDGVATSLGTVANTSPLVSMASNGAVVMLVGDGANGYFIDPIGQTLTEIIDPAFTGGVRVDFIDGYFVWNVPGTGRFQASGLYTTDISALDYATAEGSPDDLVTLIVDHREIWLLGGNSGEVWYNVGGEDFAFQRINGAFLEIGCAAPYSVAKADNSIFWLATDDRGFGTVQRATGYSSTRVSNHAVEYWIGRYMAEATIADAQAFTYSMEGHTFYVLTFPTAGATWALDLSSGAWHEWAYRDPLTGDFGRHRSNCQMVFAGKVLVGDVLTGKLFALDLETFTDDGDPVVSLRRCPHIASDVNFQLFQALELTMKTGVGLLSGQGSDPQAMLRWSDDGGYSWSSERWAAIGKIGERHARVRWRRLGRSRDRVFEVSISDPVRRAITGASLQAVACAV